jgi:hypothetical protein
MSRYLIIFILVCVSVVLYTGEDSSKYEDNELPTITSFPVTKDDPRVVESSVLNYRRACMWNNPGVSPYKGTVRNALYSLKLPEQVEEELVLRISVRDIDQRVVINNKGIFSSSEVYPPVFVGMGFSRTMCLNTRVNFTKNELGDLYQVEHKGIIYAITVPDVCGNISLMTAPYCKPTQNLKDRQEQYKKEGLVRNFSNRQYYNPTSNSTGQYSSNQSNISKPPTKDDCVKEEEPPNKVSEPSTIALMLLGGVLICLKRRRIFL